MRHEIVVIGGGVIGVAVARALRMRGRNVCLVERDRPGSESSGAAAGILGAVSETDSDAVAVLGLRSVQFYRTLVDELRRDTGREIDYWKEGTLRLAHGEQETARLQVRVERAGRVGAGADWIDADRLARMEPGLGADEERRAVLFPDEGRVEGAALCEALAADFVGRGGTLLSGTEIRRVAIEGGVATGVEVESGAIACDAVVDAAGAWSGQFHGGPDIPVEPLRGQMVCLRAQRPFFRHTVYTESVYAAARRDGRLLLGSTRESVGYRKEVTCGGAGAILRRAFAIAPGARGLAVSGWWSGLRPLSVDGLPLVGFWPGLPNYMVATGHGRNGLLLAPVTAEIVADLFDGRTSPEAEALDPARLAL